MTFDVEIVLRERNYAVTERVDHPVRPPAQWTDQDVEEVLKGILLAIDRTRNPSSTEERHVALRGFSWIVEPTATGGVVIAIEIQSGAAVAGPFAIDQAVLDRLITRVLARSGPVRPTVH
ncbi:MAG: hypothetical protein ACRD1U_18740 [Vicinamibacterales bacterium]